MPSIFKGFDFQLLDSPDFREDSVREELLVPLLAALGFSASPPHCIVRSRRLQHPYVYIGTTKKPITIIPDYLLQRDGNNAWILDAKGPNEKIDSGKNVEQAYSYAIHKDIRVPLYALCNGRRLTVFHISQWPAVLDVSLNELEQIWPKVLDLLGTRAAWPEGLKPGYFPDFGLALLKAGLAVDQNGKKVMQLFTSISIQSVGKSQDDLYVITGFVCYEQTPLYIITFDATPSKYEEFLAVVEPQPIRELIRSALTRMPYRIQLSPPTASASQVMQLLPWVTVAAQISDSVITNENESFCPLTAEKFI